MKKLLTISILYTLTSQSILWAAPITTEQKQDPNDVSETYQLEPVVVTASGYAEPQAAAPASMQVIPRAELQKNACTDLRQALSGIEGIDTLGSTGRFDTPAISIRGLDDSYTLLLVDGTPINGPGIAGGLMRSFNQLAATSLPPLADVERIEIVRGPMSTRYGSDAIGGVINIVTRKIPDKFHGTIQISNTFETSPGKANTQSYSFTTSTPIAPEKTGMKLYGQLLQHGPSRYGIEHEPRDYQNGSIGTQFSFTPTKTDTYTLTIDYGQNTRTGDFAQAMQFTSPFGTTIDANPRGGIEQRFNRTRLVLNAENKTRTGTFTNKFSYLHNQMQLDAALHTTVNPLPIATVTMAADSNNRVKNDLFTYDTQYLTRRANHTLTLGGQFQREKIDYHLQRTLSPQSMSFLFPELQAFATPMIESMAAQKSSNDNGSSTRDTYALFAEDTWQINDRLNCTYGLRYTKPDSYSDNLSPRAYLVYKASDYLTVKGGITTGYKAPTILQASPTDLHINAGNIIYRGNTDLSPEKSTAEEIGLYYENQHHTSGHLTFFHTDFRNKIELSDSFFTPAGDEVRQYENIGRARIYGFELGTRFSLGKNLTSSINETFILSRILDGPKTGSPLHSTPKHALNLQLDWTPHPGTDIWFQGQYRTGVYRTKQATGLSTTYSPFFLANLGVTQKLPHGLSLHFAINNLLDRDFDRTTTAGGVSYPCYYDDPDSDGRAGGACLARRSYWLGLTYDF